MEYEQTVRKTRTRRRDNKEDMKRETDCNPITFYGHRKRCTFPIGKKHEREKCIFPKGHEEGTLQLRSG